VIADQEDLLATVALGPGTVPWCAFCPLTSPSNSTASTTAPTLDTYSHCDNVDDILDTFPIVNRTDGQRDGEYRTKQLILDMRSGSPTRSSSPRLLAKDLATQTGWHDRWSPR
jgi:hypothetical protein